MWPSSLGTRSVGFGELSLAVAASRGIDRAGVARALHAAFEAGIDLVDVAAEDDSERLAGDSIREMRLRDKIVAMLRVPALAAKRDVLTERLPARYVIARVEAALRATKLDALPVAQLGMRAAWRTSSAWPELVDTCARLVREGKVLAWGALVDRIEDDTHELAREHWLISLSLPYSLCERAAEPVIAAALAPPPPEEVPEGDHMRAAGLTPELAMLAGMPAELILAAAAAEPVGNAKPMTPQAREAPIKILARRPLAGAALAGTLGPGVRLKPRDDRNALDRSELERIAVMAARLAAFVKQVPPAARSCEPAKTQLERNQRPEHVEVLTLAELALRYVITKGTIALPRLHRHEHVIDALAVALAPPLPADLVAQLDELA